MSDSSFATIYLHNCIARWRDGDRTAADALLRACASRLDRLARKMLRDFPAVRGWAETADVVQGACLRLLTALRSIQPASTREFFGLSALQIRRELLDLAHAQSRRKAVDLEEAGSDIAEAPAETEELEVWCRFHEAVEELPAEQREVVSLVYYHGWTQMQVAELLGISERTVRRHWVSASRLLCHALDGQLPPVND